MKGLVVAIWPVGWKPPEFSTDPAETGPKSGRFYMVS